MNEYHPKEAVRVRFGRLAWVGFAIVLGAQGQPQTLTIGAPTVNAVATFCTPSVTNQKLTGGTFTASFSLSCGGSSVSANASLTVPTLVTGAPSNDATNTFVLSPPISVSASVTGTGILGPGSGFPGPIAPLVSVTVYSSNGFLPGCNKSFEGGLSDVSSTVSVSSCPVSALIGPTDRLVILRLDLLMRRSFLRLDSAT
jgi:hypothetical protein